MNVFQLKEYYRYRRAAKGRHGVHSPFVYCLIDKALRSPVKHFSHVSAYTSDSGEIWQPELLLRRVAHYIGFRKIIVANTGAEEIFYQPESGGENNYCLYDWQFLPHEAWAGQFQNSALFGDKDMIVLHNIHRSAAHVAAWQALCRQDSVQLSLDLFRLGLLFFNPDFKERQHFVLKHPV